jgi:hypothetical protein
MFGDEYDLYDQVTTDQLIEWLKHPVTKVLGLVLAAYLARNLVLHHGARLLGLVSDEAGDLRPG